MEGRDDTESDLIRLLDEPADAVCERRSQAFTRSVAAASGRVVVYGAGSLGRKVVRGLVSLGRPPVAVADRAAKAGGDTFEGLPLLAPEDAARRFGNDAAFLVAVWSSGADRTYAHLGSHLRSLGCRVVVPVVPLLWQYPDRFLPHGSLSLPETVPPCRDRVLAAFSLLDDALSRTEYVARVRLALHGDPSCLPPPSPEEIYVPRDLFQWSADEVVADCGAYDGDTLRAILARPDVPFGRWLAFEPGPSTYRRLAAYVAGLPVAVRERVRTWEAAVGAAPGVLRFSGDGSEGALIDPAGSVEVRCMALDDLPPDSRPTYLKFDVEGAEADALQGARELIASDAPALAVSVYHRTEDLWELPLWVQRLNPGYRQFLRRHVNEFWDVVLYAVPPGRLSGRRSGS